MDAAVENIDPGLTKRFGELSRVLESRFSEMRALRRLGNPVDTDLLLQRALEPVYDLLRGLLPFARMGVAMLDDDRLILRAVWARSESSDMHLQQGFKAPLAGSSLEPLLQNGTPRIINDLPEYLATHPNSSSTALIVKEGMRASLTCPLTLSGNPVGVVFFSSKEVNAYTLNHIDSFSAIADQLSGLLEKWRLYDRLLHLEELTANHGPEYTNQHPRDNDQRGEIVIACVHADQVTLNICRETMGRQGYSFNAYPDWQTAFSDLETNPAHVILMDGVECGGQLHLCGKYRDTGLRYDADIIVFVPEHQSELLTGCMRCGLADEILLCPLEPIRLQTKVQQVLQLRESRARANNTPNPNERFARRYQILRTIGSGGASTVYAAHDTDTADNPIVALKLLKVPPDKCQNRTFSR